jgi:hypothetical protein
VLASILVNEGPKKSVHVLDELHCSWLYWCVLGNNDTPLAAAWVEQKGRDLTPARQGDGHSW